MDQRSSPPTRPNTALLVGTDDLLLYTRTAILRNEGFEVWQVEPLQAAEKLQTSSPDLIVACHTLSIEEADKLVITARAMSKPPGLVGFSKDISPRPTDHPFDVTVWSLASPETFVTKVYQALNRAC